MKQALRTALQLCKEYEGFRSAPYLCPAGVPTVGYGATRRPDGSPVGLQDPPVDQAQAELQLISELSTSVIPATVKLSPGLVSDEPALGALADFVYNLGSGRYRSSTLRKRVNDGDWDEAERELLRWVKASGRTLPGLVRRRLAEAAFLPDVQG